MRLKSENKSFSFESKFFFFSRCGLDKQCCLLWSD
jgi:hypothetical protein